jgi:hypothetical protein
MNDIEHPAVRHRYITTVSGVNIGPPGIFTPAQVRLTDIMRSLAKICRYNGHVDRFYSVAEHSVLVSRIAELMGDEDAIIPALFHDAHEAYTGDIPSPQKDMIDGAHYFEAAMERIVHEALALPDREDDVWRRVRVYDTMILHRELLTLRRVLPDWFDPTMERAVPSAVQPVGFEWEEAQSFFRARLHDLGIGLGGNA